MRGVRCICDAGNALRRVFLGSPVVRPAPPSFLVGRQLTPVAPARHTFAATRNASSSFRRPSQRKGPGNDDDGGSGRKAAKHKLGRLPRDEEITWPILELVQTDGTRGPPTPTPQLLLKVNPRTESLVVVALPDPKAADSPQYPLCKIVNKVAEEQARRERRKSERLKAVQLKELELNWAIDPHDMEHRLRKMRGWLEKGMRVEVLLMNKKHKRAATREEAKEALRKVRNALSEVPGAKEVGNGDGELGKSLKLRFDGPVGGIPSKDATPAAGDG